MAELTPQQQAELEQLVEATNEALAKQVEFQSKMTRLKGEELSIAQELINKSDAQARQAQEFLDLVQQQYKTLDDIKKSRESILKSLEEERARGRMTLENYNNQIRTLDAIFDLKEKQKQATGEELEQIEKTLESLKQQLITTQKLNQAKIQGIATGDKILSQAVGLLGVTNKQNSATARFVKSIGDGVEGFKGIGLGIASSAAELFSFSNILANVVEDIIVISVQTDNLVSSFAAIAGGGREVGRAIVETQVELAGLGVSLDEVGSSFNALQQDFVKFTTLSQEQQKDIASFTAQVGKLGVSASTVADNFNFLTSTIGMTGAEALRTNEDFIKTADALSIPFNDYNQAFQQLQPRLALFGKRGPEIFKRTAMEAKRLGLDIGELGSSLFQIADGFDEFDEAAGKIASLNLTLGGSFVNTFDVVMAAAEGPFAQVQELQKGFAAAGKSFNDLNFREQQFLAKQFGIEVQTLGAVFDGTIGSQEEFNEQTKTIDDIVKDAVPALTQLSSQLQSLVNAAGPLTDKFASAIKFLGDNIGTVVTVLGALGIALGVLARKFFLKAKETAQDLTKAVIQGSQAMQQMAASAALAAPPIENLAEKMQSAGEGDYSWMDDDPFGGVGKSASEASEDVGELNDSVTDTTDKLKEIGDESGQQSKKLDMLSNALVGVSLGFAAAELAGAGFASIGEMLGATARQAQIGAGILVAAISAAGIAFLASGKAAALFTGTAAGGVIGGGASLIAYAALASGVALGLKQAYDGFQMDEAPVGGATDFSFIADSPGFQFGSGVDDAVIQNDGQMTKITPINKQDQLIAAKPGGPVADVMGAMGGQQVPQRLIDALERVATMLEKPSDKDINITVELDKRKMGQAVVAVVDKKLQIT